MDFQGRPVVDAQGNQQNNSSVADLAAQLGADDPVGAAVMEQLVNQRFSQPKPPRISQKQIREGDEFVTYRTVDGALDRVISRSPIDRVQRVEQGGPGEFSRPTRETPGNRDKLREEAERNSSLRGELAIAMRRNREFSGAAGAGGVIQEIVEGTIGQVPGVGGAASVAAAELTGVDARQLARIRTQAKTIVARLVPVVTGDTSGRYTEQEQQRTREVQSQLEFFKTQTQIDGALSENQIVTGKQ